MSVSSSDLKFYAALNPSESNGTTVGGGIDVQSRVVFDSATLANTLNDTVEILSSSASDTSSKTCTIYGRNTAGSIINEVIALNGTTPVSGATTFERILKIVLSETCVGNITVREATGNTAVAILEVGLLSIRRLGYNISADISSGSTRYYHEKIFGKNTNGTNSLLTATVKEEADASGLVDFDLESSVNGTNTTSTRLSAPSSGMLGSFSNAEKSVPGSDLAAGSAVGIWVRISLPAGQAPAKSTWQVSLNGSTT